MKKSSAQLHDELGEAYIQVRVISLSANGIHVHVVCFIATDFRLYRLLISLHVYTSVAAIPRYIYGLIQ